jgi:hypothetical protein
MTDASGLVATETRAGELPAVIHLPDHSQPPASAVRKRGRHFGPRPVEDPRTERIDLRVTPAQRQAMKAAARQAGLSVAALICRQTLGTEGPRARRVPVADTVMLAKLLAEMGKSGSNLNQIAYQLNCGDPVELPELAAVIAEHRAAADAIMRALGV